MSQYSPYAVGQAELPKWNPGDEVAAAAFVGMTLLLVLETNVEILRMFKRRTGLYYYAISIGSWTCGANALGLILKNLTPGSRPAWPFYTLLVSVGWAMYSVAQLTILYSRLHLVSESQRLQRGVFYMIVVASPIIILSDWAVVWPAYQPFDIPLTSEWSPRLAIVERFAQLGFSTVEFIISGIYVYCLAQLLKDKSSVRQRRVMVDLIYVLIIVVSLDIINIVLVFVNRIGLSHPIQTFSYAVKLRLEFLVLNQLMAVAARGLQRDTFGERRYHDPEAPSDFPSSFARDLQKLDLINCNSDGDSSEDKDSNAVSLPLTALPPITEKSSYPQRHHSMATSRSKESKGWLPLYHEHVGHKRPSHDKPLPEIPPRRKRATIWRNDDDDQSDDIYIGLEKWEVNGTPRLQVPWLHVKPVD
ncbi:MAG: hypothetical protein Q9169_007019 [Polycauliona sp. 2 TL-2023]